jgi:hypothetical protein
MCVWIILHSQVSHRNHENIKRNICIYKSQCEFWSSYRGDVSTRGFLGCDVGPTFQRSLLPPCSAWRWRQQGPLSRWYPTTALHGVTTQKTRLEASVYTHTHTHTHTHIYLPGKLTGASTKYSQLFRYLTNARRKTWREHSEDLGVDWKIILHYTSTPAIRPHGVVLS